MSREIDSEELIEHWTILPDEWELVQAKRGENRLGFALLLRFYSLVGRFPSGRSEIPDEAVEYVARQVGLPASDLVRYEWSGRTIEYHWAMIRKSLGFRECTVADGEKLADWLAEHVAQEERRPDRVREALLVHCRTDRIEPPTSGRIDRIVNSALHQAEQVLTLRISSRLSQDTISSLLNLIASDGEGEELSLIKSDPGSVSLESMLTEINKLEAVRAIGLPPHLFNDVTPRILAGWRASAPLF